MDVKQFSNEELIDSYAYANWWYSETGKDLEVLQAHYRELITRMQPSPIVQAMKEEYSLVSVVFPNPKITKHLYWSTKKNKWVIYYEALDESTWEVSTHDSESEAVQALLGD